MSNKKANLQIKTKKLDELVNLLKTKEFITSCAKDKLDFFRQIDQESNKPLFIALAAQSPGHIKTLLNADAIVQHGRDLCFQLIQTYDQNRMGLLELVSRKSDISYLQEVLNSKVFREILDSEALFTILADLNGFGITNFALLMDQSFEYFKILLNSQVLNNMKEVHVFQLLSLPDEVSKLNSFWFVILQGEEYRDLLFNSNLLNKLNSKEISALLSTQYDEDNNDTPLGYVINHFSVEKLEKFLSSKVFKKLDSDEVYTQYILQNDNNRAILDIAMYKDIEAFKLLLECPRCFEIFTGEQKVSILTSVHSKAGSPIIYKTLVANSDYENLILNSEVLINMAQEEKVKLIRAGLNNNQNVVEDEEEYLRPDAEIIDNPERLEILRSSALFQSLDQDIQQKLLGQQLEEND